MSLWHTIRGRETMEHFPCVPEGIDVGMNAIGYFCSSEETPECKIAELCPLRPVYEEYQALRAVVQAVLGGSTPQQQVLTLAVCLGLETDSVRRQRMHDQKDAWKGLT